ncbi:MAG: hypothetical protein HW380_542 [Magnetococcales bacterium]|nr:hypothetical protein [Magnetococcales bacterium]
MLHNQPAEIETALTILEKGPRHPAFDDAWEYLAMSPNPQIRHAMRLAVEETFGPYPQPLGYSENQEPFWDLEEMSRYLGVRSEELLETAQEIEEKWGEKSAMRDSAELHLLH